MTEPRIIDAYRYPRLVREGCQHQMGCRCDPPFWLRNPSEAEQARFVAEAVKHPTVTGEGGK